MGKWICKPERLDSAVTLIMNFFAGGNINVMKQLGLICSVLFVTILLGAAGCGGDPNVEGAKLALTLDEVNYDDYYSKLDESITADPTNAEAHAIKARLMKRQLGETREIQEHSNLVGMMVESFNSALEIEPDNAEYVGYMTEAYIDEFKLGIQAFNRGREDDAAYAEAVQYFKNTSMIRPDSVDPYLNQAYAQIQAGNQSGAIMPFEKAIELGDTDADTYTYLSNLYQTNDRSEDAINLLEKAREMYPENEDVRSQLLNAYITSGQMDRAMKDYSEAVSNEPDNKLYRYNYGTLLLEAEDYDKAVEQFRTAVEIDPEYGVAYYNLGVAYVNKAVSVNTMVTELDDNLRTNRSDMNDSQIEEAEGKIEMMVEERKNLFAEAVSPLERARELLTAGGEDPAGVCQALFQALAQIGEQEKAEEAATCAGIDLN